MASLNTLDFNRGRIPATSRRGPPVPKRHSRMVRLAREGNREAFDALVEAHRPAVRGFLSNRVDRIEVDDLLQDVLVAAWRALPSYDGRSQFQTWMLAIAFNKVRDHYRSKMRRVAEVRLPTQESVLVNGADPFAAKDLSLAVNGLLGRLSDRQREVILLYYQDGLTLVEIATILGRNLSTVKYQFFQGHSQLADRMREMPEWSDVVDTPLRKKKR